MAGGRGASRYLPGSTACGWGGLDAAGPCSLLRAAPRSCRSCRRPLPSTPLPPGSTPPRPPPIARSAADPRFRQLGRGVPGSSRERGARARDHPGARAADQHRAGEALYPPRRHPRTHPLTRLADWATPTSWAGGSAVELAAEGLVFSSSGVGELSVPVAYCPQALMLDPELGDKWVSGVCCDGML
jgi:hypothetical protein